MRTKITLIIVLLLVSISIMCSKLYIQYCDNVIEIYEWGNDLLSDTNCEILILSLCLKGINGDKEWNGACHANKCFPIRFEDYGQNTDTLWPKNNMQCPIGGTNGPD